MADTTTSTATSKRAVSKPEGLKTTAEKQQEEADFLESQKPEVKLPATAEERRALHAELDKQVRLDADLISQGKDPDEKPSKK